ncbi:MAG TPA: MFS transporter [Thermoplasmata archaeon]|jgi:FSR family fosmidomycin resistance protein-like MFS transporter|nr:MFS transporter [Thermoplasmata archaeon]
MKPQGRILSTVSLIHAVNDGSIAVISILFPIFKELFNLSYTQVGIITGGGLFITLVGQLVLGRLADGKNVNSFLLTGVLLTSLSLMLLSFSTGFLSLICLIFFLRFATSFFHPIGIGWISRTYKKGRLDWAMGIQSGSADLGAFLAILTTLSITELTHWTVPLYGWACICIMGLLVSLILTHHLDKDLVFVPKETHRHSFKEMATDAYHRMKAIRLLIPAFMISGASWGIIITYFPLLLTAQTTLSLPVIGFLVALWAGVGSITSLSYGRIRTFINRKKLLLTAYILIGILSVFLALFTHLLILILLMILLGIAVFLTYPALFSFVSEVTDESVEGWTFGLTFTFQTGGGTILLFLGGVLSDLYGIWMPFVLLGLLSLLFSFVLLINYRKPFAEKKP